MRPTSLGVIALGLLVSVTGQAAEFYVAVDGDDANPGTIERPFATPERARDAIRELKQAGPLDARVTVWIRGGNYFRAETFELQEEDSGTEKTPITYRAYGDEAVHFIGGQPLEASWFGPVTDAALRERLDEAVGDQVLEADLEAHGVTDFGELGGVAGGLKLFHNARRLPLARWPDEGWAEARSANTVGLDEYAAEALAKERKLGKVLAMRYDGPGPRHWATLEKVWLRGIWQQEYFMEAWNPKAFDPDRREITMEFDVFPHLRDWRRFYVANVLEEMDAPGEWFLDRDNGRLYLLPPEDFAAAPLYASMLESTMIALSNVSHVTIRGLTLEVMRGQAVHIGGGTHTRLAGCIIRNARQGVTVGHGTHNGVVGCDIYDLGGMGVHLVGGDRQTLTPAHLYVDNCHIHHYSRLLKNWQPAVKVKGVGNRVTHCRMHHAPQYAVNFEGNDHLFEFNHMHDLCLEMSDVGVIGCGTDWTYRGNVLRHNFVHHIPKRPYPGVCGFYFDNCASSGEVVGNVFYKMVKPVMIGGGRDHIIENNIFIECEIPVYMDNRGLRWGHFREGGPMYDVLDQLHHDQPPWSTRYPKLARILEEVPQAPLGNVLARNVSVRSGWRDPEAECRKMFAKHIDRKYMSIEDNYVTDDDPGFVDPAHMDFQLRDDSVVFEQIPDFRPIPFHQIGLYQDDLRATWPSSPELPPGQSAEFRVAYKTRGIREWRYKTDPNLARVQNLDLVVKTDFRNIDYPGGCLSPMSSEEAKDGMMLTWRASDLITRADIGVIIPERLNPGPLTSRITFFAPVCLVFFFVLVGTINILYKVDIHPMHYLFVAAGFFAFHLLLVYMAGVVNVHVAFIISAVVAVVLVTSYLSAALRGRFPWKVAAGGQLFFLVLFSYSFFLKGITGLTIAICSVVTLGVLMRATAHVDWEALFSKAGKTRAPTPPPLETAGAATLGAPESPGS